MPMRAAAFVLLSLVLAGCSATDGAEPPAVAAADDATTAPVAPEPFNVTSEGRMEFGTGVEHAVMSGCTGQTFAVTLLGGNSLTVEVPDGLGNVTGSAEVSSASPLASYRLCVFEDGEELGTVTGPSPLTLTVPVSSGTVQIWLYPDNSDPPTAAAAADFHLRLDVTA